MHVKQVSFQNFRNFQSLDLSLNQGFVIFAGPNGMGKTNFLEGLYFGLSLSRFPTSKTEQLFREGENFFRIKIIMQMDEEKILEVFCQKTDARASLHLKAAGQISARARYVKECPVISFIPEDLNLLSHSPANRRRFLDEAQSSCSAEYRRALAQYNRALKQRNEALETGSDLDIWDEQLVDFGSKITAGRNDFLNFIDTGLPGVLGEISPELKNTKASYIMSGFPEKAGFAAKLQAGQERDRRLQTTSVGPHRDDFELQGGNRDLVGYLSRGQLRALTLALKILERQYLESVLKTPPLILLDDVFSEFDANHQRHLLEFLKTFPQAFLTTAHLKEVQDFLPANSQLLAVNKGVITNV